MGKAIMADNVRLKRAYETPAEDDGRRILVDRLWPRGVRKADAAIDRWIRNIAPSAPLRRWFGHDPGRWKAFRNRYAVELRQHPREMAELRRLARHGRITLVYAARDEARNNALALRHALLGRPLS